MFEIKDQKTDVGENVLSAGLVHLPHRTLYSERAIRHPLCGLVQPPDFPSWTEKEVDCPDCPIIKERMDEQRGELPPLQLDMFNSLD
jgi:hypothetical protein